MKNEIANELKFQAVLILLFMGALTAAFYGLTSLSFLNSLRLAGLGVVLVELVDTYLYVAHSHLKDDLTKRLLNKE